MTQGEDEENGGGTLRRDVLVRRRETCTVVRTRKSKGNCNGGGRSYEKTSVIGQTEGESETSVP